MFFLLLCLVELAAAQDFAITAAPTFLFKRQQRITDCDGPDHALWTCPTGECYWGDDGFVGCCSVSSCAPRTRCIEYKDYGEDICDHNTGGCVVCSKSESPFCVKNTNPAMTEYGFYCAATALTATSSFTYELPRGAIIRTIKDSQEPPITTEDAEPTDDGDDTEDDATTSETETTETTETDATETDTTETETATEGRAGSDEPTTTGTDDDITSTSGTADPSATGLTSAEESELSESKNKLKSAIAAASALGAILATLLILAIAFIWYRRRQRPQQPEPSPQPSSQAMMHSQPSSVPTHSNQYYHTTSNPPSASISPPNTSFGGSNPAPSPTSRTDEQMTHIPELGRYRY